MSESWCSSFYLWSIFVQFLYSPPTCRGTPCGNVAIILHIYLCVCLLICLCFESINVTSDVLFVSFSSVFLSVLPTRQSLYWINSPSGLWNARLSSANPLNTTVMTKPTGEVKHPPVMRRGGGGGGPVSCSTYLFLFCFLLFCQSHLYPMTASVMLFIPTFLSRQSARALHILMFFTPHVCVRKAERPKRMSRSRPQNERGENVNNICDCVSEAGGPPPPSECVHTVTFHPWLWTLSYDPVVAVVVVIAETSYRLLYPECSGPLHKCSEAKDNRD